MECNRDEATRAKEIAESKFSRKDITGAKKFALKAQTLYPGLDGISQLIAVLDVYVAAEHKINGELDFYGILGVSPLADDKTVRKHYRELALSLHPDKNKSTGADGAFKYISEAFSILSDKEKRSTYDHKRNGRGFGFKQTQNNGSRAPPPHAQNGFHNFTKSTPAQAQHTKSTPAQQTKVAPARTKVTPAQTKDTSRTNSSSVDDVNHTMKTFPTSVHLSSDKQMPIPKTFWTVCKRCKLQYEFVRMYLNRNLLCPTCHGPFLAQEVPPPNTKKTSSEAQGVNPETSEQVGHADSANHSTSSKWAPFLKKTGPADVAQAASMVQEAYGKVKRDREEAQAVTKREEALRRKISKWANKLSFKTKHENEMNEVGENKETDASISVEGKKDVSNKSNKTRLINKATMEIKKKLHEWSSEVIDDLENGDSKNETEMLVIDVQDSDFHDFDEERSEKCFKKGQVWAAYDDRDEMPRFYAMIREVVSLDPFKMKICWLNPEGLSPEFLEAFGEFKPGKHDIVTVANYFSHKANFKKQENGNICVFPMKGDVCALYRNRNDPKPDMEKQNYEIVQVDEYDKETGITVTPLAKVAGFKTVFQRQHINSRNNGTRVVLGNEMFRFSHQIPSYMLTGEESENAPKGCCELDPAAIPPEFLEVMGDDDKDCVLADYKEGDDVDVEDCGSK
ncbi:uncharacterized protein LOC111889828 [Lactuca sativa]|nr:uncharacterized protein LOC111889828 [Lactuca sativa]